MNGSGRIDVLLEKGHRFHLIVRANNRRLPSFFMWICVWVKRKGSPLFLICEEFDCTAQRERNEIEIKEGFP